VSSLLSKAVDADAQDGLGSVLVKIEDGSFTVPEGIQGYSFVLVTSASDISAVSCELLKLMPGVPCADPPSRQHHRRSR